MGRSSCHSGRRANRRLIFKAPSESEHYAQFNKAEGITEAPGFSEIAQEQYKASDIVYFQGGYHYSNAESAAPTRDVRTEGNAKITLIVNGGKHPTGVKNGSDV